MLLPLYKSPRLWISVILTLLVFERWTVFNTPFSGLDGSWIIAVHLAHQLGLVHGADFVFTYGPLGWLITRLPDAGAGWAIVLFDLLWLTNVAFVLYLAIGKDFSLKRMLFITGLVVIHHQCASSEVGYSFYFFVLFWLAYHQRTNNRWALAASVGMAVMTLYLKANVGLVCVGTVALYGLWPWGSNYRVRLIAVGSLFFLILVSAYFLPVQLYPFLVANLHLIDSYNDVMYNLDDRRSLAAIIFILGLSSSLFGFAIWKMWRMNELAAFWQNDGLLLLLIALQVFVLYKEAVVRADDGHTALFFKYGSWPFGLIVLFCRTSRLRRMALVPVVFISLAGPPLIPYHWYPNVLYGWVERWTAYCQDVVNPKMPELEPVAAPWPDRWFTQLRDKRVDIMPVDISLLFKRPLRYAPRPVIQTYQATDTYLDSLNAAYFLSDQAPDYVLLTVGSTDGRDPFADETRTKLALLRTYHVADTTNAWLLLQRRPAQMPLSLIKKERKNGHLNEVIPVPYDSLNVQLWQIEGHYGVGGFLSKLIFQPPQLKLELTYETGETKQFRTALPLLQDGLLLPGHPGDIQDLNRYWQAPGQLPLSARVKSFRIVSDSKLPAAYKAPIEIICSSYRLGNVRQHANQLNVIAAANSRLLD